MASYLVGLLRPLRAWKSVWHILIAIWALALTGSVIIIPLVWGCAYVLAFMYNRKELTMCLTNSLPFKQIEIIWLFLKSRCGWRNLGKKLENWDLKWVSNRREFLKITLPSSQFHCGFPVHMYLKQWDPQIYLSAGRPPQISYNFQSRLTVHKPSIIHHPLPTQLNPIFLSQSHITLRFVNCKISESSLTAIFHIFHGKFVLKSCKLFLLNSFQLHFHPFLFISSETILNQTFVISMGHCSS